MLVTLQNKKNTTGRSMPKKNIQLAKYKKAPQAPRRFKSSFMFFSIEKHRLIREEMAAQEGEGNNKPSTTTVAKMVSQAWKDLSHDEREVFEDMARRDKARYEREKRQYRGPWRVLDEKQPKRKDPNAPKRPMSAFLAFSNSKRSKVKIEHGGDLGNAELSRILAQMWKDAPEDERKVYIDKEFELRREYKIAIAQWRKGQRDFEQQEKTGEEDDSTSNNGKDDLHTDKNPSAFGAPTGTGKEGEPTYPAYPYYYMSGYQHPSQHPFYPGGGVGSQHYQQPPPGAPGGDVASSMGYHHHPHMSGGAPPQHPPPPYYWSPTGAGAPGYMPHHPPPGSTSAYPYYPGGQPGAPQADPYYSPPPGSAGEDATSNRGGGVSQYYYNPGADYQHRSSSSTPASDPSGDPSSYYNNNGAGGEDASANGSAPGSAYGFLPQHRQYQQQSSSYYPAPGENEYNNGSNYGDTSVNTSFDSPNHQQQHRQNYSFPAQEEQQATAAYYGTNTGGYY